MYLSKLADKLNINPANIVNEQEIDSLGLLASKTNKRILSFAATAKYFASIPENVTMLLTTKEAYEQNTTYKGGFIISDNPRWDFFAIHNALCTLEGYARPKFENQIAASAKISPMAWIADSNVMIGENVVIEPFVTVEANTVIGDNSIIRSGVRLGGVGFEFKRGDGVIMSVEHVGGLKIADHVEIQYNTVVDRAIYPWDDTMIGSYTKIDDLCYIAHAVKIEPCVLIASSSVIGGRVEIATGTWLGLNSTVRNGMEIGKDARVNMAAAATQNVPDGVAVSGNFGMPHDKFIEHMKKLNGK